MLYGEIRPNEDGELVLTYIGESAELPVMSGVLIVSLEGRTPFPSIGWFYDDINNVFSAISSSGGTAGGLYRVDQERLRALFTLDELTAIRGATLPDTTAGHKMWVCWDYLSSVPLVDLNGDRTQEILAHFVSTSKHTSPRRDTILTNTLP